MTEEVQNTPDIPETISTDLLRGAKGIARFLGMTPRKVYYLTSRHELPVFRLGEELCARRSTLLRHLDELERLSQGARQDEANNNE